MGTFLNAPPGAVITNFEIDDDSPCKHCQIALGSLSNGISLAILCEACSVSISPAITMDSLLAIAIFFLSEMQFRIGLRATCPVVAITTMSDPSLVATVSMSVRLALLPQRNFEGICSWLHDTNSGANSKTCCLSES